MNMYLNFLKMSLVCCSVGILVDNAHIFLFSFSNVFSMTFDFLIQVSKNIHSLKSIFFKMLLKIQDLTHKE